MCSQLKFFTRLYLMCHAVCKKDNFQYVISSCISFICTVMRSSYYHARYLNQNNERCMTGTEDGTRQMNGETS